MNEVGHDDEGLPLSHAEPQTKIFFAMLLWFLSTVCEALTHVTGVVVSDLCHTCQSAIFVRTLSSRTPCSSETHDAHARLTTLCRAGVTCSSGLTCQPP